MTNTVNKVTKTLSELAEKLALTDAVIKTSVDGKILSWSLGAEKMYGYTEPEVKGNDLNELLQQQQLKLCHNFKLSGQLKECKSYEAVHFTKDSKRLNVLLNVARIKDSTGNVIGNSLIIRNITERRLGAPLPPNEAERLKALHEYRILDTQSEDNFDDLTKLASYICQTPIALISFLDQERQWFKSKVGLEISETNRNVSFCGYTILQKEVLQIEDALLDERFFANSLVNQEPHIRFYAGAPLLTASGVPLGSICVIDNSPRKLNFEQVEMLKILSRMVMRELDKNQQILLIKNQDLRLQK